WVGLFNTEALMRIYQVSLEVVASVCSLAERVQQYDKDLARQMRRASSSVPLNMSEGMYSRGGNRIARFHDAMGSARETMACLHVCVAARACQKFCVRSRRIDSKLEASFEEDRKLHQHFLPVVVCLPTRCNVSRGKEQELDRRVVGRQVTAD